MSEEQQQETEVKVRKDIVPGKYREQYKALGGNCGDFIAAELSAVVENNGMGGLANIKAENNIPAGKWGALDNGQQRMNLSNTLRAAFLRGEVITILGKQYDIEALHKEYGETGEFDVVVEAQADDFLRFISMPVTDRNRKALIRQFKTLPEKAFNAAKRKEDAEQKKAEKAEAKEKAAAEKAEKAEKAKAEKAAKEAEGDAAADGAEKPKRSRGKKTEAAAE